MDKDIFSLQETAEILDLSYQTILSLVKKGYLVAVRHGSQWRVNKDEIERFKNEGNLNEPIDLVSIEEDEPDEVF